jgi:CO/xanthine dehydrogenase FAD-binding subunit
VEPRFLKHQPTLGGNVCAGGALLAPLALLGARAEVASLRGSRRVPVQALALQADELLIALELPEPDMLRSGHASLRRVPSGPVVAALALGVGPTGVRMAVQYVEPTVALRGPWPDAPDLPDRLAASLHGRSDAQAGSLYRQAMAGELARRLRTRLDQPAPSRNI